MTALHAYPIALASHNAGWRREIFDTRLATVTRVLRLGQEAASALIDHLIDGNAVLIERDSGAYRLTMCGIVGGYGTGALAALDAWKAAADRGAK